MEKFVLAVGTIVVGVAVVAGFGLALAFPIKWCWNYAIPHIFGLPSISWGQAWCLLFLAGMFFKPNASSSE